MNKNVLLLPVCDGGVTKVFNANSHKGIDFGWYNKIYCDILACDDGEVVDVFYSSSCGYSIVLQHNYDDDGTHRWTGYIHLLKMPTLKKGDKVKMGDVIGTRGNSGQSNGVHLHIYVSGTTTKSYSWETMKSLCKTDPMPLFYKSRKYTYTLAQLDKYLVNKLTYMEDIPTTNIDDLEKTIREQAELIESLKNQLQDINTKVNSYEVIINGIKELLK